MQCPSGYTTQWTCADATSALFSLSLVAYIVCLERHILLFVSLLTPRQLRFLQHNYSISFCQLTMIQSHVNPNPPYSGREQARPRHRLTFRHPHLMAIFMRLKLRYAFASARKRGFAIFSLLRLDRYGVCTYCAGVAAGVMLVRASKRFLGYL